MEAFVFPDKCEWTYNGAIYVGSVNVTTNGIPCFFWTDKPFGIQYEDEKFADGSAELAKNYCRNPTPEENKKPWCFADRQSKLKYPCATCLAREDYSGEGNVIHYRNNDLFNIDDYCCFITDVHVKFVNTE